MLALRKNNIELVKLFLQAPVQIDYNKTNAQGETALEVSKKLNLTEITSLIEVKMREVSIKPDSLPP